MAANMQGLLKKTGKLICIVPVVASSVFNAHKSMAQYKSGIKDLDKNWYISSSDNIVSDGSAISSESFNAVSWYKAKVPGTVLASLVRDGIYKDVFFDRNLDKIPDSVFKKPWWYRCSFELPKIYAGQVVNLLFNGINYKADIWLNGRKIASGDSVAGGFRRFRFDVSKYVKTGKNNLAILITRPDTGDLTLGFVDWNPNPPDHNMGIWRNVRLEISGPVAIQNSFIRTDVDTIAYDKASLEISADLRNYSEKPVEGMLSASIGEDIKINKPVTLLPNETKTIALSPSDFKNLIMHHPQLWWTYSLGNPKLYKLSLTFTIHHVVSDSTGLAFGIRKVSTYFTPQGFRGFKLNGKKILITGGGWTDPMLLDADSDYVNANIGYVKQMNLNTIRMEGFWGSDSRIFDMCDREGILIMAGLSCQWEWKGNLGTPDDQYSAIITPEQNSIAAASFHDQVIWLRNHPSVFVWLYGSDKYPRPSLERQYLDILKNNDPDRPYIASAKEFTSTLSGNTGVKMRGPYDYVPPIYWYVDSMYGGAFGFNTETGPGPEVPVLESLKKMIPADSLWPISLSWIYHAARHSFYNLAAYNNAMNRRLGEPATLTDYLRKAQYLNYEGMRPMYEAFESNRFAATGIIQWMLNASWPKLWWQLYDYYLMPTAAFYAARKANERVHIAYNYGNNNVEVINNTLDKTWDLTAKVRLFDFDMHGLVDKNVTVSSLEAQGKINIFTIDGSTADTALRFLQLELRNARKELVSSNFYVLASKADSIDEHKSNWYITRQSQYAELAPLQQLPKVKLQAKRTVVAKGDSVLVTVALKNTSSVLAFMVHVNLMKKADQRSVVPIFWDDNYISLLPGDTTTIKGYCHKKDLEGEQPEVTIDGWNVDQAAIR